MKRKTLIQILLGVAIIGLAITLYMSIMKPVKFDNEYNKRRDACAEKLKAIRTLEEAYKNTYGCYTGSFDTLFNRLMNEDSLKVVNKNINYDKIPEDVEIDEMTEADQIKAGYVTRITEYVNPIENLRKSGKFNLTDEEILNLRYVPYPRDQKNEFDDLDEQLVINKLAELVQNNRFPGWKVGDLTEAITDGNFE